MVGGTIVTTAKKSSAQEAPAKKEQYHAAQDKADPTRLTRQS
jgi:hypothetical protein